MRDLLAGCRRRALVDARRRSAVWLWQLDEPRRDRAALRVDLDHAARERGRRGDVLPDRRQVPVRRSGGSRSRAFPRGRTSISSRSSRGRPSARQEAARSAPAGGGRRNQERPASRRRPPIRRFGSSLSLPGPPPDAPTALPRAAARAIALGELQGRRDRRPRGRGQLQEVALHGRRDRSAPGAPRGAPSISNSSRCPWA